MERVGVMINPLECPHCGSESTQSIRTLDMSEEVVIKRVCLEGGWPYFVEYEATDKWEIEHD